MATIGEVAELPQTVRRHSVRVLLLPLMIAMLLSQLDNMVVATAMPTVVGDLGGLEHLSWVVTAYTLATAAATPIWGKLGDMHGRKGVFITAVVIFLVGSVLCGMAQDMGQLIGFRTIQGLGAGGLMAGVIAIVGDLVPPREQGKYQGMIAGLMALAMIGGPLVGGTITDHLGWRWAFYINLPIGLIALVLAAVLLDLPARRSQARVDYLGAALLMAGITSIVLLTTWGGTEYAWGSGVILSLAAAGVLSLAAFLHWQTRAAEPIVPLHIFRNRNFSLMAVLGAATGFVMFGAVLFLPLYQQTVQGASATNSGLLLLPMLATMIVVAAVAGKVTSDTGRYKVFPVAGGALLFVGMYLISTMDTGTSRPESALYMALLGAGLGCLLQITTLVAQNSVQMKDIGVASAAAALFRTLGSSFGVAVMGALFHQRVAGTVAERMPGRPLLEDAQLSAASLAELEAPVREAYRYATAAGTHTAFLFGTAVGALALVAGLLVKEVPLRKTMGDTVPDAVPATASELGRAASEIRRSDRGGGAPPRTPTADQPFE
ncbi:MDR family MFS transporter [Streptomyces sp. NPDC006261]|uniref:MDR family MFS transporter n=1 Tax=Streptomyces sp. NPDC006261 TaxID=3156739 RepID=UPI0033AFD104